MVSTKAHPITGARITASSGQGTADASQFEPVFRDKSATFPFEAVVGDGAYANRKNVALVGEQGARPFFPTRIDGILRQFGAPGWAEMVSILLMHRQEFDAIYHARSNVESVNSAISAASGKRSEAAAS